jgi:O-antigen/teichoic acid export membrane protein
MKLQLKLTKQFPQPMLNVFSNWAEFLASMLISFFLSPFVIHHLGASVYGAWLLIMTLTGYLGLLDFGGRAVTRYIARFHIRGEHGSASGLVATALAIFTLLGVAVVCLSAIVPLLAVKFLHEASRLTFSVRTVVILAGATVASSLVGNIFGAVVMGLQRFELASAIQIGAAISKALMVFLALERGKGLVALAIINLVVSVAIGLSYFWLSRRLYPQLQLSYALVNRGDGHVLFSFGGQLFLLNASAYLILYSDLAVIGAFLPVAMITFYAIASNLVAYSRSLITGISSAVLPLVSSLKADGNRNKVQLISLIGPRYTTMMVLPIIITLAIRGRTFIGLWMGFDYAGPSSRVLQVLCLALFFGAANQVATSTLIGVNKHGPLVFVNMAEGVLNLALSICLVRFIGIVGVAWGTAIPIAITSLVFWPAYIHRTSEVRSSRYVVSTWIRPALAAAPFALISFVIEKIWYPPTVWFFFLQVAFALPVAIIAFWFGCISRIERCWWVERAFPKQLVARNSLEARPVNSVN